MSVTFCASPASLDVPLCGLSQRAGHAMVFIRRAEFDDHTAIQALVQEEAETFAKRCARRFISL